jgi:PilZ domain-containing protein
MIENDRRRHQRVTLPQPIRAAIGPIRVYVLDASVGGMRVAHQAALPHPGEFCRIEVPSQLGPICLDCEVVRTTTDKNLFQSALEIIAADRQSAERLRNIFGDPNSC